VTLRLAVLEDRLSVYRLPADEALPGWADLAGELVSITRTAHELSVVCPTVAVPEGVRAEHGFRALEVQGPLDFALTGVAAALTAPLAAAAISVLVIATHDTDYVLVREDALERALGALRGAGCAIV